MRQRCSAVPQANPLSFSWVTAFSLCVASCVQDVAVLFPLGAIGDGGLGNDGGTGNQVMTQDLSSGESHTCSIRGDTVFCWGSAENGRLGALTQSPQTTPLRGASGFLSVTSGGSHTCALRVGGAVVCFGRNHRGQLGAGDQADRATPFEVPLRAPATLVTAGIDHSCAVLNDGSAFCWGENAEGQLGIDAAASEALSPRELPSSGSWRLLAAGQGHTCGIQRDGSLWCWGRNTSNHLGLGSGALQQIRAPVRVGTRADWASLDSSQEGSCAIGADARVSCWGNVFAAITNQGSAAVPTAVGSEQWAWFSVEVFHGCGVRDDRSLWCSGRNVEGQLGTGDNAERQTLTRIGMDTDWQSVSVGRFHTCARKTNGDVFCTGINDDGRLGTGDTNRRNTFTLTR